MKRYKLEVFVSKQRSHGAPLIRTVNSKLKSAGSWSHEVCCLIGESDVGEQVTAAPLIALRKPGDTNSLPGSADSTFSVSRNGQRRSPRRHFVKTQKPEL